MLGNAKAITVTSIATMNTAADTEASVNQADRGTGSTVGNFTERL